jgi:hypothetical protein
VTAPAKHEAAGGARGPLPWNGTIPRTRFFDALSLLLPAGEAFVIDTLEGWSDQAGVSLDAAARCELDRFIREERAHQRAHRLYNRALVESAPSAAAAARRAEDAVAQLQPLPLVDRVALAAAFEQLTALLSHEVLAHGHLLPPEQVQSSQARLWRWHAAEEIGHCHVATQAADQFGVRAPQRALALCLATGYLGLDVLRAWTALCRSDIAAGASRRTVAIDTLDFAIRSTPSMARMALGWLRCVFFPHRTRPTG